MDTQLAINVCGPVALILDERPLRKFRSRKAIALMIYLACNQSEQSREKLADLLWDASTTKQALSNLRTVLSMLRLQVTSHIVSNRTQIGICAQSQTSVDYLALLRELDQMPKELNADTAKQLSHVLQLYRGEFLEDFTLDDAPRFTQWVHCRRHALHASIVDAYQRLANFHLAEGNLAEGIAITHRWLQHDPVDEVAHAVLIKMLAKSGRRKAAMDQYSVCRKLLNEELDVEPAREIQQLALQLLA